MHQYDLQPKEEHSTGEYLGNATKTEPNPIENVEGPVSYTHLRAHET